MHKYISQIIVYSLWTLLIGLLVHFVAYNIITFKIGLQGGMFVAIRMRKEIIIGFLCGMACYLWYTQPSSDYSIIPSSINNKNIIQYGIYILTATIIRSICSSIYNTVGLSTYILSFRYDFLGFVLGLTCIYLSKYINKSQIYSLFKGYGTIIKIMLIGGLLRYTILIVKPGALKLLGYTTQYYEGEVGKQAPAVYYTQQFQGYPRNQFLFERPIHYGFWLIMIRPLFFMLYLRRKSWDKVGFRWVVYGLNIMTTFSRAARGVRVIEIIILGLYTYRSNILFYIKKIIIPLLIIVGIISIIGYSQIIGRDFSNTGHFLLLQKGLTYITQHRIMGLGAGSVGPASYQHGGSEFNPENQFIQIFIEFGIIGFVGRILLYLGFTGFGLQYRNTLQDKKKKDTNISIHIVVAMSIGMIGLAIAGLVLHSFVDRMIVLPMMICTGLAIGLSLYHQEPLPKIT